MKKIAQIILAVVIVALVYVIYDQISTMAADRGRRPELSSGSLLPMSLRGILCSAEP